MPAQNRPRFWKGENAIRTAGPGVVGARISTHRITGTCRALQLLAILGLSASAFGQSSEPLDEPAWRQFLGSGSNLTIKAPALRTAKGEPSATIRWRRPLGAGYSQPTVSGNRVFVAESDGENDRIVALDLASGETRWTYTIGPTWRGVDGSDDGPMSTPVLNSGLLIGLGPRAQLFALDVASGQEKWRVDLKLEHGATAGNYGVATSPLCHEGMVIVQMGAGPGKSIAAFDQESGKLLWSAGDDAVGYQSPQLATLLGVQQLVAVTSTEVSGLDPTEGTLLWKTQYLDRGENHSNPMVITASDRFLVVGDNETVAYRIERQSGSLAAVESWRSRELKGSYSYPVAIDRTLYGWNGDFFAAVDAETGQRKWKTRGVGPGALLALGDWIAIWTVEGRLLFVDPSPDAFRQVGETKILDAGSLVNPVWTGDGLLLRGPNELVAVAVQAVPAKETRTTQVHPDTPLSTGRFAKLQASLVSAEPRQKKQLIGSFLAQNEVPLIEDDGTVTFLYHGEAEDVALIPGSVPVESVLPMTRLEGTELWFRIDKLNRNGAYEYLFEIDGERSSVDPLNDRRGSGPFPISLLLMPAYKLPPALSADATTPGSKGELTAHTFRSKIMDNERTISVYTPAGFTSKRQYPLVLVLSGGARFFGHMPRILDQTMGKTVEPAVVVFVDVPEPVGMNVFYESLGGRGPLYTRLLVEELIPWVEKNYGTKPDRARRFVMGVTLQGSRALATALLHPGVFAGVAAQSPGMNAAFERELERMIEGPMGSLNVYLDWCERDSVALAEATVVKEAVQRLLGPMRAAGISVTARELPGGYGWAMWSTQTEYILSSFLPMR